MPGLTFIRISLANWIISSPVWVMGWSAANCFQRAGKWYPSHLISCLPCCKHCKRCHGFCPRLNQMEQNLSDNWWINWGFPRQNEGNNLNFSSIIDRGAISFADKITLAQDGKRCTYERLKNAVEVLYTHAAVEECAVVGMQHPEYG